jgi:2-oxoglutarate ferredoxin oxidoreductase subunit gamma
MYYELVIAGFGGQGILLIGDILTHAAMYEGKEVSYLPTYGVEMRGGTANCAVTIADEEIGSVLGYRPDATIIMNQPSLDKFQDRIKPGGFLLLNTALTDPATVHRSDIELTTVAANDVALELGNVKVANMVVLGAFLEKQPIVERDSVFKALKKVLPERHHRLIDANIEAINAGAQAVKE